MMRTSLVWLGLFVAGCSSSSPGSPDFGPAGKDASANPIAQEAGGHDDTRTVCDPLLATDAGLTKDGESDAKAVDSAASPHPSKDAMTADADAGHPTCLEACIADNALAYEKFLGHQLTDCGCTESGECYSACHESTSADPSSACGSCLAGQTADGLSSTCTLTAAEDCKNDTACTAFQTCAGTCPM
jgi:hypothetical protein